MGNEKRLTYQERMVLGIRQVFDESCLDHVSDCNIQHDVWCGINRNQPCDCDPDIYLTLPKGRFTVDRQGNASPVV